MDHAEIIKQIKEYPAKITQCVKGLSQDTLNKPIREGGWTCRQTIQHLAEAQIHGFNRTKYMMAEDHPTINPFDQDKWTNLPDAKDDYESSVAAALSIITGIYAKWGHLVASFTEEDWQRKATHPESGELTVEFVVEYFVNHGQNHLKQLQSLQ